MMSRPVVHHGHRWRGRLWWGALVALTVVVSVLVVGSGWQRPTGDVDNVSEGDRRPGNRLEAPPPPPPSQPRATAERPVLEPRIPRDGDGRFRTAAGGTAVVGRTAPLRYRVEVERGLPFDPRDVAGVVDATLADARGWIRGGEHAFQRVSSEWDIRVLVATPSTTDRLCAPLDTRGRLSCRNGALVVINANRWAYGSSAYAEDVANYRRYVVNHEVGHALGFGHLACPEPGRRAPVMLQQTLGLQGCRPNPWPNP